MMPLAWRALLVVVLLLACVAPASAECAWVLWHKVVTGLQALETPIDALTTKKECDAAARETAKAMSKDLIPGAKEFFVCLPDTVDPRGPKTK